MWRSSSYCLGYMVNGREADSNGRSSPSNSAGQYYEDHPLRAAAYALQNLAGGGDSDKDMWGSPTKDHSGEKTPLTANGSYAEAEDLSGKESNHHDEQPGVVRLAPTLRDAWKISGCDRSTAALTMLQMSKLEYAPPAHQGGGDLQDHHNGSQHIHPQQVEVIKTVPALLSAHEISPRHDHADHAAVLAEMVNMPAMPYDPAAYQRMGGISHKMPAMYDPLCGTSASAYLPLPSTHNLLPAAAYPNLIPAATHQDYYRQHEYYTTGHVRSYASEGTEELIDRLNRAPLYKPVTVDLPSPVDSGIGQEMMMTPKQEPHSGEHHSGVFDYNTLQRTIVQELVSSRAMQKEYVPRQPPATDRHIITPGQDSPVHIPKMYQISSLGFQYTLEAPISTSVRKEDDRMTYVNKGQFYTISLEYIPDPLKPLKSNVVKSVLMLVFREEKCYDEEIKCWQFWHSRQHSPKQRILDVDTKNSTGIINGVEEIAHNAVAFYWNTQEQPVKINVAVQCLSTDFSNQKGVKGFPLHLQIDTFDEMHSKLQPFHRGYCQIKVFCDKGANRKMLHEQRREEKRRMQGRKKSDGEYHEPCERSEFYHMSNLTKPAVLFIPPEDYDRFPPLETFYNIEGIQNSQPMIKTEEFSAGTPSDSSVTPSPAKRQKLSPPDRVMIYIRQQDEQIYTPLHLCPPSVEQLVTEISEKYNLDKTAVTALYRQNKKGVTAKVDDEMIKHYCNEDTYLLQILAAGEELSLTLIELGLDDHAESQLL